MRRGTRYPAPKLGARGGALDGREAAGVSFSEDGPERGKRVRAGHLAEHRGQGGVLGGTTSLCAGWRGRASRRRGAAPGVAGGRTRAAGGAGGGPSKFTGTGRPPRSSGPGRDTNSLTVAAAHHLQGFEVFLGHPDQPRSADVPLRLSPSRTSATTSPGATCLPTVRRVAEGGEPYGETQPASPGNAPDPSPTEPAHLPALEAVV